MNAAITFIIPAFNAGRTIGDTLGSLVAQTRDDWCAIVIDDGSSDGAIFPCSDAIPMESPGRANTLERLLADPRIQVIRQANSGVAATRNRGLSLATSPAVCFLDADDAIEPDFIQRMIEALNGHDLVSAAYRYAGPNLEDVGWIIMPTPGDRERLTEFNQYALGAIVFDRAALLRIAGDRPFPSGSRQEDWELLISLANAKWGTPVPDPLYSYRLSPQSRTTALCEIWRDGLNLIARHSVHPSQALRRWSLRNLARAAASEDRRLCIRIFEHLDSLIPADIDTLSGALRWSMRRMTIAAEAPTMQSRPNWHASILDLLGNSEHAAESLRRAAQSDWDRIAVSAAALVGPEQTLVIYGLGRNGRDLLKALQARDVSIAIIDDSAPSHSSLPRLTIADLGPNHIVLVTPDDRAAILKGLVLGHQAQILLPEQLVA